MVMRYAMIVGAAVAAVLSAVNLGQSNANAMLVDAGQGLTPANAPLFVLGLVAFLIGFSLCRFVIFGLVPIMSDWYRDNKLWLFVAGGGTLMCGLFYLI